MIKDPKIVQAVSSLSQRAERQRDIKKIINSYVEVGIMPQLMNNNNQILYGRRGTGKTHILKYYQNLYVNDNNRTICFIDCRILGSSPQFSDTNLSLSHRCSSLFIDILNEINDTLLNHIAYCPNKNSDLALNSLNDMSNSSIGEIQKSKKITDKTKKDNSLTSASSLNLDTSKVGVSLSSGKSSGNETEKMTEFNTEEYEKILFPDLHYHLKKVLEYANTELIIVIDEWSAIPIDIQPFLAEFLKKSFIPTKCNTQNWSIRISLKFYNSKRKA